MGLEKAIPKFRDGENKEANGGLMPPTAHTARPVRKAFSNGVKECSSLTGFTLIKYKNMGSVPNFKSSEEEVSKPYQHTQIGYAIIISFSVAEIGIIVSFVLKREMVLLIPFILISIVEILFFLLTVRVDESLICLKFGIGLIQKTIPLSDISSCRIVRNSPLCGWGIRCIGNGWLYNVSGLDAVEILLKNERRVRIGTDDPNGLLSAIQERINR